MEPGKEENVKNYIIIEVRENPDRKWGTDAGDIRGAVHKFIKERGINAADMIFREDRKRLPGGVVNTYPEVRGLFENTIAKMRASWEGRR